MYLFRFRLTGPTAVSVGKLGAFTFAAGWYIYTGSAMAGLRPRLLRHYRGSLSGRLHWHIDYLARLGHDKTFRVMAAGLLTECELNAAVGSLAGARVPAAGLGSSDCACGSHLHWLPRKAWPAVDGILSWKPDLEKN